MFKNSNDLNSQRKVEFAQYAAALIQDIKYQTNADLTRKNDFEVIINTSSPVEFLKSIESALQKLPEIGDIANAPDKLPSNVIKSGPLRKSNKNLIDATHARTSDISVIRYSLANAAVPMLAILKFKSEMKDYFSDISKSSPASAAKVSDYQASLNAMSMVDVNTFKESVTNLVTAIDHKLSTANIEIKDRLLFKGIAEKLQQQLQQMTPPLQTNKMNLQK